MILHPYKEDCPCYECYSVRYWSEYLYGDLNEPGGDALGPNGNRY